MFQRCSDMRQEATRVVKNLNHRKIMSNVSAEKIDKKSHWQKFYQSKLPGQVSWFQAEPTLSLQLIDRGGPGLADQIIDVGGGAAVPAGRVQKFAFFHLIRTG